MNPAAHHLGARASIFSKGGGRADLKSAHGPGVVNSLAPSEESIVFGDLPNEAALGANLGGDLVNSFLIVESKPSADV